MLAFSDPSLAQSMQAKKCHFRGMKNARTRLEKFRERPHSQKHHFRPLPQKQHFLQINILCKSIEADPNSGP